MKHHDEKENNSRISFGILFIILGVGLLLAKFDIIAIGSIWNYWPAIFVIMGTAKLINAFSLQEIGAGIWWIFFGSWLFVSLNHIWGLSFHTTWPAILVAWGASMIWKSQKKKHYSLIEG